MQRRVRILHRRRLVLVNSSQRHIQTNTETSHAPCLTLRLKKGEDVVHPDWALDVTNDATARVVKELYPDLCDTTTRTGTAEDLQTQRCVVSANWHSCIPERPEIWTLVTVASLTGTFAAASCRNSSICVHSRGQEGGD